MSLAAGLWGRLQQPFDPTLDAGSFLFSQVRLVP
jgi:hypothetical protein